MIEAKIIADSISEIGDRITTFELVYPRFVHCFDEQTEILSQVHEETPEFRTFEGVFELGAKVAQYDQHGEISFVYPLDKIVNKGTHKMVSFDKKKLSMFVTDEHRVHTFKRTTDNCFKEDVILAKDLLGKYGTRRIVSAGSVKDQVYFDDCELALIAWFVADGHRESHNTSSFHFKKERKVSRVKGILDSCEIDYKEHRYLDSVVIRFDSPDWVELCYDQYGNKQFPDFIWKMTNYNFESFKEELLLSDGNLENGDYNTCSDLVAEQLQVLSLLHENSMNIRKYNTGMYKQKFQKTNYISIRHDKDVFTESIYVGNVYCVTVPSSFVVVRRKGVAYVSGNCELMTHRLFSRNAASSRAIPIDKMLAMVEEEPAMPVEWGKNQAGMQAKEVLESRYQIATAEFLWKEAAKSAVEQARRLQDCGLHKQIVNRVTEPFVHMKTVVTATEYNNWFWLRCHPDAQPEIKVLAEKMEELYNNNKPFELDNKCWHMPYYLSGYWYPDSELSLEEALKISSSCCAQVSFRNSDDSLDKAIAIYDRLVTSTPIHASPFEHQATPINDATPHLELTGCVNYGSYPATWQDGVTHVDRNGKLWSGNFKGWVQHRQLIEGHTKW